MSTTATPTRSRPASWGPSATLGIGTCGDAAVERRGDGREARRPQPEARGRAGATAAPPDHRAARRRGAPGPRRGPSPARIQAEARSEVDEPGGRARPGWRRARGRPRSTARRAGAPWLVGPPTEAIAPPALLSWSTAYPSSPRGGDMGRGQSSNTPRIGSSGTDCRRSARVEWPFGPHDRPSISVGTPSICLAIGLPALVLEPALHARPGRLGRPAGRVDPQGGRAAGPRGGAGPGPGCGPASARRRRPPAPRSQALEEAGPLAGPERRRAGDVEAHLDPRVGGVGVLAPRTAGATEPPAQLVDAGSTSVGETRSRPGSSAIGPA